MSSSEDIKTDCANSGKTCAELIDLIYMDTMPDVDENVSKFLTEKVKKKDVDLVSVVEELGPRLTSTRVQERAKAVEILAHIFTNLPVDFLTEKELTFIVDFLCDRCKDQHFVTPKIILCIFPIVKSSNLPSGAGGKLMEQLFREINIQSHVHKVRHTFFRTLQILLKSRLQELQAMSSDFIMHFLQAMDGEKDPRNLLLLFRITPYIISQFELGLYKEDFYEILSCYFPVDFNPTMTMPGEELITRKDLASALHVCLSQTNEFGEFLLPLILEKLESSSVDAKVDSLDLLQLCCERSYLPQDIEPYLGQIWHIMRKEIFMGGNDDVEKKCYECLRSAFKMISKDSTILSQCLTMIFSECKHHLSEPELRLIMPTSHILQSMAESGETVCCSVISMLFPVLYEQICMKASKSEKKRLLGIWETIIRTCCNYKGVQFDSLVTKWDEIRGLLFTLLTDDDMELVTIALKIFSHLIRTETHFELEYRNTLQEHLLSLIQNSSKLPHDTRLAVVLLSRTLCYQYGEEFSNLTISRLLSTLCHLTSTKESLCGSDSECKGSELCEIRTLSYKVLGKCAHLHEIVFEKVVSLLIQKIKSDPMDLVYINCLGTIIEEANVDKEDIFSKPHLGSLFIRLSVLDNVVSDTLSVCSVLKSQHDTNLETEGVQSASQWEFLRQSTCSIRQILQTSDENEQSNVVMQYFTSKLKQGLDIDEHFANIPGILVEALLGPLRPSVAIPFKKELIKYIVEKALRSQHAFQRDASEHHNLPYARLLGSLINKVDNDDELNEHLEYVRTYLKKTLQANLGNQQVGGNDTSHDTKVNLINALVWTVKGLAMRGFTELDSWLEMIVQLLEDESLGTETVSCFHILVADDPFSLNTQSFCKYRFLYKQRLFLMAVDKLVSGYRKALSKPIQFNFIQALSSQLKHVPSEILFMEIDSVLPLLVASLKCNSSSQVLLSTLNALTEMMNSPETKEKLTEYSHDLVPQLTHLAQFKESMEVRVVSLKCLRQCIKAPPHVILPLRDPTIHGLIPCLDDPKRLVRKEAALARNLWLLIGAPGGL